MIEHNESYQEWLKDKLKERDEMRKREVEIAGVYAQRVAQEQAEAAEKPVPGQREGERRTLENPHLRAKPSTPEIESLLSDLLLIVVAHARFNRDLGEAVSRLHGLGVSGQRDASAAFLGSMKVAMRRIGFYQAIAGDLLASLEEAV